MTSILTALLTLLARWTLWRFRPRIVGVTGNVGKTSTKEAIAATLRGAFSVRTTGGNLNNELGLPLTIIGDFSDEYYRRGPSVWFWFKVLAYAAWRLLVGGAYPEILVLEYGADRPGDIRRLAHLFRPDIAVITGIGEIPSHVEFFASPRELAAEKANLVRAVPQTGAAILNFDDLTVLEMRDACSGKVATFGFGDGADVRVMDFRNKGGDADTLPGISFSLEQNGERAAVALEGMLGEGNALAAAAAVATASALGMPFPAAAAALSSYHPPKGRMHVLRGVRGTRIIDDTYNASPAATHLALDTLADLSAARKIAVLGDMLELGSYTLQAHQDIGNHAAEVVNILVCVGERSRMMYEAALNQLPKDCVTWYPSSRDACLPVQNLLHEGDLVLIKGSQGMRMERIVEEVMAEPERVAELLVRQSARWRRA